MIASERTANADMLEELEPAQWDAASLCAGWRVREVAAHLVTPFRTRLSRVLLETIRRGGVNAALDAFAKRYANEEPVTLVAVLRANVDNRFTPPVLGPQAPLTDAVVHGLDIRVPLGLAPDRPPATINAVLAFLMTKPATRGFVAKDRTTGLRFVAQDTGWSDGVGPDICGPGWALALAITGRRVGLDHLSGDGVTQLRKRFG